MTQPSPLGPLDQLIGDDKLIDTLGWHYFEVVMPYGGRAGRWCTDYVKGQWTFKPDFGRVYFWIKDDNDAMFFKLTWGGHIK